MNKLAFFVALRYAHSKRKLNFITIISILSTLGIAIGVAALIIVLSVFNGFSSLVTSFMISLDPHVRVEAVSNTGTAQLDSLQSKIKLINGMSSYTPYVSGKLMLRAGADMRVVNLKGTTEKGLSSVYEVNKYLADGKIFSDNSVTPGIMMGSILADYIGLSIGDTCLLISPSNLEAVIGQGALPLVSKVVLRGTFYSKNNEYDVSTVFISLEEGQRLLGFDDNIQGYDIRLKEMDEAANIKESMQSYMNESDFSIKTWHDLHSDMFSVMVIERWAAYMLLMLIIIVAVFNILASLTMTVIEKKRNIGIMRTMGMTPQLIKRIYLFHGFIVGVIGTIAGFGLGLFVYWLQVTFIIYPLDATKFKINALPVQLQFTDFLVVGAAAIGLSLIAALIPANRASKIDALEAIRWE